MLQIKNTLGGGKPEGLYAWRKYSVSAIKSQSVESSDQARNVGSGSTTVYYATSYTFDENTGIYTLVNPSSTTDIISLWSGEYVIFGATSGTTMYRAYRAGHSNYCTRFYASTSQIATVNSAPYSIYTAVDDNRKTYVTTLVSDNGDKYPDGIIHTDGYYYAKVALAYGKVSLNSGETITIPHMLGSKPTLVIGHARTSNSSSCSVAFMYDGKTTEVTYADGYFLKVSTDKTSTVDETNITIPCASSSNLWGKFTYDWIAISA